MLSPSLTNESTPSFCKSIATYDDKLEKLVSDEITPLNSIRVVEAVDCPRTNLSDISNPDTLSPATSVDVISPQTAKKLSNKEIFESKAKAMQSPGKKLKAIEVNLFEESPDRITFYPITMSEADYIYPTTPEEEAKVLLTRKEISINLNPKYQARSNLPSILKTLFIRYFLLFLLTIGFFQQASQYWDIKTPSYSALQSILPNLQSNSLVLQISTSSSLFGKEKLLNNILSQPLHSLEIDVKIDKDLSSKRISKYLKFNHNLMNNMFNDIKSKINHIMKKMSDHINKQLLKLKHIELHAKIANTLRGLRVMSHVLLHPSTNKFSEAYENVWHTL